MCGRFAITLPPEAMRQLFRYAEQPNFPPRYNIAPTQPVPVVRLVDGERHFVLMKWAFLPGWVKDPKDFPLVFNVRSETMREKPSFRSAFLRRRVIMPADGFYEWQKQPSGPSRPFLIARKDRAAFAFAALFETWTGPEGSEVDGVAIVTREAVGGIAAVHGRMPVILDGDDVDAWLDPATPPEKAAALCAKPVTEQLELIPIGPAVNKVAQDGPEIQMPVQAATVPPRPAKTRRDDGSVQGSLF